MQHGLRTCWLSLAVAEAPGANAAARSCVYYVALLRFVGCTSDASETAADGPRIDGTNLVACDGRTQNLVAAHRPREKLAIAGTWSRAAPGAVT